MKIGCLLALTGMLGLTAIGEDIPYSRRDGGVVFKGVQVFNVSDLVSEGDGRLAFRRAPAAVHTAFGRQGQAMNMGTTGVEFRFVMKGDSVKLRLGMPTDDSHARFTVYHGDMIGDWPELNKTVHGREGEIVVRQVGNLAELKAAAKARGDRFDPEVVRLVMSGPVGLKDVIGAVEPPPAEMLPKKTYLAYGSSITHGSNALSIEECYASLVGKGLGADVRNLGFAGSAALEKEVADFIAGERFDFATLEMGINVLGMDPLEFERRVRYFVRRIATSHPQAKVLAIDVFGNRMGTQARSRAAAFRSIVKRVVDELSLPNVVYVNGLEILPDDIELCSGGVHPTPEGHAIIAKGLLERFRVRQSAADVFDVRRFGAIGDGIAKDTAAVQAAIDAAARAGGGEVRVPAGRYICGTLYLKSNVDVNVSAGATIEASKDEADYNRWDFCPQNYRSQAENTNGGHLIVCLEQTNVVLRGAGRIDGNGVYFMTSGFDPSRVGKRSGLNGFGETNPQDAIRWRPAQMLWFCESSHIRLEGLRVHNAPYWSILLYGCDHVAVRGLEIATSRRNPHTMNGDGLNIDCCRHVRVSDCDIDTSDDSLCLRASGKRLLRAPRATEFVSVANCLLSSNAEAIRIGVGSGSIADCVFANCVIRDSERGINFSATWFPERGCDFRNIRFDNIVSRTRSSFLRIHRLRGTDSLAEHLHFSNISGTQGEQSYIWARKSKPFRDISLVNVCLDKGIEVVNVEDYRQVGGTLRLNELSSEEYARRCGEIERFERLLY